MFQFQIPDPKYKKVMILNPEFAINIEAEKEAWNKKQVKKPKSRRVEYKQRVPDTEFSAAYWGERNDIDKIRYIKVPGCEFDRAYYQIPYPQHQSGKRINIVCKNIAHHTPARYPDESTIKGKDEHGVEYNDISGINVLTHIVQDNDTTSIKYEVFDGGIILSTDAARRLGVDYADKVLSRGGLKGVVSNILKASDMPFMKDGKTHSEMVIGRTKISTKAIEIEMENAGDKLFIFKIKPTILGKRHPDYYIKNRLLSNNFREVMASNKDIFEHSKFPRQYSIINRLFNVAHLNFTVDGADVVDGTGIELNILPRINKGITYPTYPTWIEDKSEIKHFAIPPTGEGYQYTNKEGEIKNIFPIAEDPTNPDWFTYEKILLDKFNHEKTGYLKLLTRPHAKQHRGMLIPRFTKKLDSIILSKVHEGLYIKGEVVMVFREPIISSDSIQFLKIDFRENFPEHCIGLNPQNMKPFNADCDGDALVIIKGSKLIDHKLTKHVGITGFDVLEGTWDESGYGIKPYKDYEHSSDKFRKEAFNDEEKNTQGVKRCGGLRQHVIATTQHLGFDTVDKLCRLYSVEKGMSKATEQIAIHPMVNGIILDVIWHMIRGRELYEIKPKEIQYVDDLKEYFNIEERVVKRIKQVKKKAVEYDKTITAILVDYPKGIDLPVNIKKIYPTSAGFFMGMYIHYKPKDGLKNVLDCFNIDDDSVYGQVFRGFKMSEDTDLEWNEDNEGFLNPDLPPLEPKLAKKVKKMIEKADKITHPKEDKKAVEIKDPIKVEDKMVTEEKPIVKEEPSKPEPVKIVNKKSWMWAIEHPMGD